LTLKLQNLVDLMDEVHNDTFDIYRAYLEEITRQKEALKKKQEEYLDSNLAKQEKKLQS
jgi:hypothetical protein